MADDFVYRADPPARLTGADDLAALVSLQVEAGLNVLSPGTPVDAAEIKAKGPDDCVTRLSAELAAARQASGGAAVKLAMPLPGTVNLDPMLLSGLMANLVDEGASILELDAAALSAADSDASNDGFTLMGLPRPEGFRLAIHMGPLADWTAEKIEEIASELQADRYVFALSANDDFAKLSAVPEEAMIVLGLLDPAGGQSDDEILDLIDKIAETIDQDRLALSTAGGFEGQDAATQDKVLRQLADISVRFWGFAM